MLVLEVLDISFPTYNLVVIDCCNLAACCLCLMDLVIYNNALAKKGLFLFVFVEVKLLLEFLIFKKVFLYFFWHYLSFQST